ncbi:MAG: response regulator, partial [Lentisphaeraceae bacterium]|nr:response regulator [Lentisphaeraceae bacterium]
CNSLQSIFENKPDLILLDMKLGNKKGFALNQEIHKIKPNWDIPIIYLSPSDDSESILEAFNNGGVDYITLPYSLTEVLALINTQVKLQQLKEQAEKSAHSKSAFLATLSHEIRTPMTGILGVMDILRDTEMDHKQHELMDTISYSGTHLLDIINSVLDYSKIEAGQMTLHNKAFPLLRPINKCIEMLTPKAKDKNLFLRLELPPQISSELWVISDEMRFRQLLLNLLNNAVKFTERGGISLILQSEQDTNNLQLNIAIKDSGIGIKPEDQQRVFQFFTRSESSNSDHYEGCGLGLGICDEICNLMNGSLSLDSVPKKGSTFQLKVSFPIADEDSRRLSKTTRSTAMMPSGLQVILAEDNKINRIVIQSFFNKQKHSVFCVCNGRELLDELQKKKYDLILMDVQMPEINGLEAARKIRQSKESYAYTPIIALTAGVMSGDREKCLEAGMNLYLSKPFTKQELFRNIARIFPAYSEYENSPPIVHLDSVVLDKMALKSILQEMSTPSFEDMIKLFKSSSHSHLTNLCNAQKDKDWKSARQQAHNLAGAASTIGLILFSKTAHDVEKAILEERYEQAVSSYKTLTALYEQSINALNNFMNEKDKKKN